MTNVKLPDLPSPSQYTVKLPDGRVVTTQMSYTAAAMREYGQVCFRAGALAERSDSSYPSSRADEDGTSRPASSSSLSDPCFRYENRIAELIVALEDAQRLLAFAGCPTDWIDQVLRGTAGDSAPTQ